MRKSIYLLTALAFILSACAKDDLGKGGESQGEVVLAGGFADKQTRTSLGDTDLDKIPVLWSPGDAIGAYTFTSGAVAVNAKATLTEGAGLRDGKFVSLGITMADVDNVFYMYYPYDKDAGNNNMSENESPIKFIADGVNSRISSALPANQKQLAPDDLTHCSKYGHSVAISNPPANKDEEVKFTMEHLLTYIELQLYGSMTDYCVEEVNIIADAHKHLAGPFQGKFDGTYVPVTGIAADFANDITLTIEEPVSITASEAQAQKFLISMLPIDLTGSEFKVVVKLSKEVGSVTSTRFYAASLSGKNFRSDCLTRLKVNIDSWMRIYPLKAAIIWEETGMGITNTELVSGTAANDLSAKVANSYIINAPGTYSFPAKMADGSWIDGVEANEYNNITFTVPAGAKGNALIGLYRWDSERQDGSGNKILYSWHIWVDDPQDVVVNGLTILDRDLGATNAAVGSPDALGYYYQWGRKDPFLRAKEFTSIPFTDDPLTAPPVAFTTNARPMNVNTSLFGTKAEWTQVRTKQTYASTYHIPTHFIDGTEIGILHGHIVTDGHTNMPNYITSHVTLWPEHANPCPSGYHVTTMADISTICFGVHSTDPSGQLFDGVFFPFAGFRNNEYGNLRDFSGLGVGYGLLWINTTKSVGGHPIGKYAESMKYGSGGVAPYSNGRISGGRNIRCVKN